MGTSDLTDNHRRVHIIDDLLGAILVLTALGFALLLELTRRRICAVYQLAFILSLGVSFAVLVQLSLCSCQCCCLLGSASVSHRHCFAARVRANMSLYITSFVALSGAIGTRLNVRLRHSAINPEGGTIHWTMIRAPFFLAMTHIGSLAFVILKIFLQHADKAPIGSSTAESMLNRTFHKPFSNVTYSPPLLQTLPQTSLLLKKKADQVRRPVTDSAAKALADVLAARGGQDHELQLSAIAPSLNRHQRYRNNNDGDVSSLISSDSDSDDDVLQPVFKSITPTTAMRSQHSVYSRCSSSPPASPTSSVGSSLSTSPITRARARLFRTGSIASESVFWSDHEDTVGCYSDRPSTASTASTASLEGLRRRTTTTTESMTPRHLSTGVALQRVNETRNQVSFNVQWIPCVDPSTGRTYFLNQQTGESRWGVA
ncbi:WW domain [Plasmopara halstedii]|uniref:WW domain n=1 Tax=Plasmopara halstedii TaxID=4781 RepID=A0A0P1B5P7_PLAHL|nr:WW domain [Plasmopara halstedii]CEG49548.1 WW domain [Plasmopara halstedii]|eukprot:XP_024585917.1 WW domain [Plasmopara halstedii]